MSAEDDFFRTASKTERSVYAKTRTRTIKSVTYVLAVAIFAIFIAAAGLMATGILVTILRNTLFAPDMDLQHVQSSLDNFGTKDLHITASFKNSEHSELVLDFEISNYKRRDFAWALQHASKAVKERAFDKVFFGINGEQTFYLRGDYFHSLSIYDFTIPEVAGELLPEIATHAYNLNGESIIDIHGPQTPEWRTVDWFFTRMENGRFEHPKDNPKPPEIVPPPVEITRIEPPKPIIKTIIQAAPVDATTPVTPVYPALEQTPEEKEADRLGWDLVDASTVQPYVEMHDGSVGPIRNHMIVQHVVSPDKMILRTAEFTHQLLVTNFDTTTFADGDKISSGQVFEYSGTELLDGITYHTIEPVIVRAAPVKPPAPPGIENTALPGTETADSAEPAVTPRRKPATAAKPKAPKKIDTSSSSPPQPASTWIPSQRSYTPRGFNPR